MLAAWKYGMGIGGVVVTVGGNGRGKGNLIGVTGSIENVHIYSF